MNKINKTLTIVLSALGILIVGYFSLPSYKKWKFLKEEKFIFNYENKADSELIFHTPGHGFSMKHRFLKKDYSSSSYKGLTTEQRQKLVIHLDLGFKFISTRLLYGLMDFYKNCKNFPTKESFFKTLLYGESECYDTPNDKFSLGIINKFRRYIDLNDVLLEIEKEKEKDEFRAFITIKIDNILKDGERVFILSNDYSYTSMYIACENGLCIFIKEPIEELKKMTSYKESFYCRYHKNLEINKPELCELFKKEWPHLKRMYEDKVAKLLTE